MISSAKTHLKSSLFRSSYLKYLITIIHLFQKFENDLVVERVMIDGMEEREWKWVLLSKDKSTDKYIFKDYDLDYICGGVFSSFNVEIVEAFIRVVKFSLIRRTTELTQLFIYLLFETRSSAQVFLEEIRSRQRTRSVITPPFFLKKKNRWHRPHTVLTMYSKFCRNMAATASSYLSCCNISFRSRMMMMMIRGTTKTK